MSMNHILFRMANVRCEKCQTQFRIVDFSEKGLTCSSCGLTKAIERIGEAPSITFDKSLVKPAKTVSIERIGSTFIIEK